MEEKLEISEVYLDEALSTASKTLVGKIMKRFETLDDKETIKIQSKELVYELFRDLKAQLKAFNCGVKFITPKTTK
jgi:hypothetical protein